VAPDRDDRSRLVVPIEVVGRLLGIPCEIRDLSVTGARVMIKTSSPDEPAPVRLSLDLDGTRVEFGCVVRRLTAFAHSGWDIGLEFEPGQETEIARLAVALFHPPVPPHGAINRALEPLWQTAAA
jgi:hypothetical protein